MTALVLLVLLVALSMPLVGLSLLASLDLPDGGGGRPGRRPRRS